MKQKCIEDSSLAEEVDRNWSEVLEQNYIFDRTEREVCDITRGPIYSQHVRALKHSVIRQWIDDVMLV